MDVLDAFAGNSSLREECSVSYRHLRALEKEKEEVSKKLSDLSLQKDFNESILGQLKDASLREGELEELEAEEKVLSNAEDIKDTLLGVESSLQGGDETPSVDVLLKECARSLSRLSSYLPDAEGLSSGWNPPVSRLRTSFPKCREWRREYRFQGIGCPRSRNASPPFTLY